MAVNSTIPLFRFEIEPDLVAALRTATERVLDSRRFVLGDEVAAFEREFAAFCGVAECVGVANGTDALELALRAVGVEPGDRVATVANAGYYASAAIAAIGAVPAYVDVDERTLSMAVAALDPVLASVRAVVVTHLYGRLADVEAIVAAAGAHGVPVVEDCAHAHGAHRKGRRAGAFGAVGCFSFYPTKNLGALGDAGAVVTGDSAVAARIRSLRQYGWREKYEVVLAGGRNSRLDELQAAVLRAKLPWLERWNAARVAIARRYREAFAGLPLGVPDLGDGDYVAHLFVVRSRHRDALRAHLAAAGVGTDVHYPRPDHLQPALAHVAHSRLPVTEAACGEVLTLPCFPGMRDDEIGRVSEAVRAGAVALATRQGAREGAPRRMRQ